MVSCNRCDHFMVCQYDRNNVDKCSYFKSHANCVEVVRCKDCKHYKENDKRCDHPCLFFELECYDHWIDMGPNDFCSYGERREGE